MLERVWRKGNTLALLLAMQIDTATMEDGMEISFKKLGIKAPYDPAIALLVIHSQVTRAEKDTCNPLFIAALLTIGRAWKQPRCPLTYEWIKKLWYIHTMKYYSAIKSNVFESVPMRWVNLETIIQNEVSQKAKDKYCILMHIYGI